MSIQPYDLCPCGSGKQHKWCCQSYYPIFIKALEQLEKGQKATARSTIDGLTTKFADIPQAWCYRADCLSRMEEREEAEKAVEQALKLAPDLPFANFMKGMFRFDEGETAGALLLFRRAAEKFSHDAKPMRAEVYSRIAQLDLQENRPVASLAAIKKALESLPNDAELRNSYEAIFGKESRLLASARADYQFRTSPNAEIATAMAPALELAKAGQWTDAAKQLDPLARQYPDSMAVHFNLGLLRAWLGDNKRAIELLVKATELSDDTAEQVESMVLGEILRSARGLEANSDYLEHRIYFQIKDGPAFAKLFNTWATTDRLMVMNSDEENATMSALVLEAAALVGVSTGSRFAHLQSFLVLEKDIVRIWHHTRAKVDSLAQEIRQTLGQGISEPHYELGATAIGDILADMMVFPLQEETPQEEITKKREEAARTYFEDTWLPKSLKSLNGGSPLDAANHPTLKKRLPGLVQYLEESFYGGSKPTEEQLKTTVYDLNRLRKKLGLVVTEVPGQLDFDMMDTARLATLDVSILTTDQLVSGFQAALKLDAPDVATKYAKARIAINEGDRYPFYQHLISQARQEGNHTAVMELLTAAVEADRATNDHKRALQYRILTGQALARAGKIDEAYTLFKQAVAETPTELSLYGPAAETMLGKNLGAKAMEFITSGLELARSKSDRNAEQQFLELTEAAKKRGG